MINQHKERNILFTVRKHASYSEEFQFAITVIAERILLHDKDHPLDIEKSFITINRILREKVEELQKGAK